MPPTGKAKKPAQAGKKEEKSEAKKPLQEKKAENAPAKAKKEGAPKPAGAAGKKDPATKPAADAGKGKDKGKKRKLNETQGKGKQTAVSTDSKKKKVEKKVQGKTGAAAQKSRVGKKPVKKVLSSKVKGQRKIARRRRKVNGKQEIVVYEGRRYFLLPSGGLKAMLDIKLEENDKVTKVEGTFIKKSDIKTFQEFKDSIKSEPATAVKRKLKMKLTILRRTLMKDLLKEARVTNKPSLATAKDAGKEVQVMSMYRGSWVRKRAVPRLVSFVRNKTIKIKAERKEKGPKELTEAEQKSLQRYTRKILHEENRKLRQALLSKRPSVAGKQNRPTKKSAKKAAPAKGKAAASKAGADSKKQKRPAKKAAN